eukprot:CFRG0606T1
MQALMAFRARAAPLVSRSQTRMMSAKLMSPELEAMAGQSTKARDTFRAANIAKNAKMYEETVHHASGTTDTWKKISLFGAIPGVLLVTAYCFLVAEHQHFKSEDDFIQYAHLRKRVKAFPWGNGDDCLFKGPNNY